MHGVQRIASLPLLPASARLGRVAAEEQREAIAVERRDDPPRAEEPDRRDVRTERLGAVADDALGVGTGAVPGQITRDLLQRDRHLHPFRAAIADGDLALEARAVAAEGGGDDAVQLGGGLDERLHGTSAFRAARRLLRDDRCRSDGQRHPQHARAAPPHHHVARPAETVGLRHRGCKGG